MRSLIQLRNIFVGIAVSASLFPAYSQTTLTFNIEQPSSPLVIDAGSNQQITEGTSVQLGGNPTASATTMVISALLATTVTGGVLRRSIPATPGSATCNITMAMRTRTTTISRPVFLSVASGINGINLFGSLII